ncbi:MAG TPA: TonB-dependent receptor [Flavobacteriales bacterium]|nr:TonB-dependent receptor [Flavobacteriales bacterium]
MCAHLFRSSLLVAFWCVWAPGAFAQISLVVRDDVTGDAVPYAHVTLDQAGATPLGAATNGVGSVDFPCVPSLDRPARIRVSFIGYETLEDTLTGPGPRVVRLQRKTIGLGEAVVTGQYGPNTAEAAVHRVRVLDAATFQRMAANNLGDALRNELNIRLAQDNVLGSSLSMQGMGGQNVKILVDGIPVIGRQDGNIDLGQLDLTGIDRAEIVEGPLSVSYGTNALAGTINLITRKAGRVEPSFHVSTYAEHIGRFNVNFSASRSWRKHSVLLSGGRNYFGGWDPGQANDPGFSPELADTNRYQQWKPREQYFGRLNYRWSGQRWTFGYKGEVMHDMILSRGMPRPPYNETAFDERYITLRLDNALTAQARFGTGKFFNGFVAHNRYRRIRNTWFTDLTTLDGVLTDATGAQDTSRFDLTNFRAVLSSAPDSARLSWECGLDLAHETGRGQRIDEGRKTIGDYAAFGSLEYEVSDRLILRPGLRYGYNTRYSAPVIPSVNMRWRLGDALTLRASYAAGFRAPSLKELYFFFVDVNHDITGNPDLQAERSRHASLALAFRKSVEHNTWTSEMNLFYNHVRDQITLAQLEGMHWTYVNLSELRTAGGSIGAGRNNGPWNLSAGGAVTARLDAVAMERNGPWSWTPEFRGSLTRQWREQGFTASLFWKYTGEQVNYALVDDVDLVRGTIAPYHMADVTMSKRLCADRITLTAGCKDLFDVQNLNASLAGGVHNVDGTSVPMSTGRTVFLRVEFELKPKREG